MAHITGTDRAQVLLLPDTVDDYVGPDNPVRFIDAFVDSLDLAGAELKRLKQLEEENRRLKKRVADVSLDNQILKEVFSRRSGPSPAGLGR